MHLLFDMDKKDYDPSLAGDESKVFRRDSARAVIFRDGKLAVIYSQKNHFYKIPGGGIEAGENPVDAMIREVKEESGLNVIRESVKEMGYVHRIQKGKHEPLFIQDNYYYYCDAEEGQSAPCYSNAELAHDFTPDFVPLQKAIEVNTEYNRLHPEDDMIARELRVMKIIKSQLQIFEKSYQSSFFKILYDECDEELVKKVTKNLEENLSRLLAFFNLEKLKSIITVQIFSELEGWRNFLEQFHPYYDYIIGEAGEGVISVLSFSQYAKTQNHKNDTLEVFEKVIVHEFVHVCHREIIPDFERGYNSVIGEGLATFLSGQSYNKEVEIPPKEIIFDWQKLFSGSYDVYSIGQKVVRQLAEKVSHQKLLEYSASTEKLYEDWETLFG